MKVRIVATLNPELYCVACTLVQQRSQTTELAVKLTVDQQQ
jgi:hypothetical protein